MLVVVVVAQLILLIVANLKRTLELVMAVLAVEVAAVTVLI
jgi:hypothetical protein